MKSFPGKLLDALILSIPLLVMVLLAAVSWWLMLITPELSNVAKSKALREEPDLTVNDFTVERFDSSGALRSSLQAEKAERYPATNEIVAYQIDLMTTESTDESENVQPVLGTPGVAFFRVTAVADRSILRNEESMIELLDNAHVTRQPYALQGDAEKIEFRGNELKILLEDGKMFSDQPVDISQEGTRFTANTMVYDYATNTLQLKGRVIGDALPPSE